MYKIMFIGDKVKVFVNKNTSFTIPYNQYKYLWTEENNMKNEKRSSK